ncbi:extracellular solute-binding protein [Terrabacter sp. NPDC080008]|uniref:sugar ABC transporter substrate-binding protein n=1 Tax=Terrabacter sp. NPDC080008 TaxID=3155176 RepID=UPI00344E8892
MRRPAVVGAVVCLAGALGLVACAPSQGTDGSGGSTSPGAGAKQVTITMMITSNRAADTKLQQDTVRPWEDRTGNTVEVVAASDIGRQLSQGFSSGAPPDLFFTDAKVFPSYAKAGDLVPYGDQLEMKSDFYDHLVDTFTYGGKFYCAPKDFSTLALVINTDLWERAGLSHEHWPQSWTDLETVARKLTSGTVKGLVIDGTHDGVGPFMKQAGGWIVNADQTKMTADTPGNLAGLTEVQRLLASGTTSYPTGVGAASGAEALGQGKAAMAIEGPSAKSVFRNSYPNLRWQAAELPAGPAARGTLMFTQCYGVAAASKHQAAAIDLVKYLSTEEPALTLAKGLGVMPAIKSAAAAYKGAYPSDAAFIAGVSYAQGPVTVAGMEPVLADFDTQLQTLPQGDPQAILTRLQTRGEAVLK